MWQKVTNFIGIKIMFNKLFEKWGDQLAKILISLLFSIIALIPLWLILLVRWLLEPEGFWQKLVLYGLGFYFLGFIQLVLLIVLLALLVVLWTDK